MQLRFTTGDTGNDTISGVISGAGNLVKAWFSGTLTLSGTNTTTGSMERLLVLQEHSVLAADSGLGAAPGSATAESI